MLFTIAIPTYNNETTIANAIGSALAQSYKEKYEVLVVNNASKDKTLDVILKFRDDRLRVVSNNETIDMYSNHNVCLKEAKGDYILFCHSDDTLMPNALSILSDKIIQRNYPLRYIIWGHSMYNDYYNVLKRGDQDVNVMFSGEMALKCFVCGGLTPSGTCYSRRSLMEIGGFPPSSVRSPEMDWVIMMLATFNFFEFEMMDRMIFKRVCASTAVAGISKDEHLKNHKEALEVLYSLVSETQKVKLLNMMIGNSTLELYRAIKNEIPYKIYIKYYIIKKTREIISLLFY